jgi:hypothetical protein
MRGVHLKGKNAAMIEAAAAHGRQRYRCAACANMAQ